MHLFTDFLVLKGSLLLPCEQRPFDLPARRVFRFVIEGGYAQISKPCVTQRLKGTTERCHVG